MLPQSREEAVKMPPEKKLLKRKILVKFFKKRRESPRRILSLASRRYLVASISIFRADYSEMIVPPTTLVDNNL